MTRRAAVRATGLLTAGSLGLLGLPLPALAQLPTLPPDGAGSVPPPPPVAEPAPAANPTSGAPPGTEPSVEILPEVPPETRYPETPGVRTPARTPAFDEYRLGPGDAVFVSVQRFPDLSFQATLDFSGNVIVPIAGAVPLQGQTLEEATDTLRQIYNRYVVIREAQPGYQPGIIPPDVTLALTAQRGVEVTILGEVERPGFYPLPQPRVSTALAITGGATLAADLRNLVVQRRVGNQIVEETVDLFTPLKQGGALPDLR
ncbi:MAG: polysaccharide biosynthesis/export family protein, partial [Cyanobacteria bacterium P01_A01_bin.105]